MNVFKGSIIFLYVTLLIYIGFFFNGQYINRIYNDFMNGYLVNSSETIIVGLQSKIDQINELKNKIDGNRSYQKKTREILGETSDIISVHRDTLIMAKDQESSSRYFIFISVIRALSLGALGAFIMLFYEADKRNPKSFLNDKKFIPKIIPRCFISAFVTLILLTLYYLGVYKFAEIKPIIDENSAQELTQIAICLISGLYAYSVIEKLKSFLIRFSNA